MAKTITINGTTLTEDEFKSQIENFLRKKKVTLWADWSVIHQDSMNKAVNWFSKEIFGVADQLPTVKGKKGKIV